MSPPFYIHVVALLFGNIFGQILWNLCSLHCVTSEVSAKKKITYFNKFLIFFFYPVFVGVDLGQHSLSVGADLK